MSDKEKSTDFTPFADYSPYLALYQGTGILTLSTQQTAACTFEAGQLKKGDIFLVCKNLEPAFPSILFLTPNPPVVLRFDGITNKGFHLSSAEEIILTGTISTTEVTCWLRTLSVDMVKDIVPYQIHYGLTNFLLTQPFPLHLVHAGVVIDVRVEPIKQYENISNYVRMLKMVDVTCEVTGLLVGCMPVEQFTEVVDNLCYLLSVAQGIKINWLYQTFSSVTGECLSQIHQSHVAKIFRSRPIIPNSHIHDFIEKTYDTYVNNRDRYQLNTRLIDLYLDAKAESDYLQVRGAKMAIALEATKAVFTNLQDNPIHENILTGTAFKKLQKELCNQMPLLLEKAHLAAIEGLSKKICDKLPELKRRAFRELLDDIFERIHFQIDDEEKERFIRSRNKLVHEGRFYCEAESQKAQKPPSHQEMTLEYFFMVSVLDRVILKLLEYQGLYKDNRIPGRPTEKWLA